MADEPTGVATDSSRPGQAGREPRSRRRPSRSPARRWSRRRPSPTRRRRRHTRCSTRPDRRPGAGGQQTERMAEGLRGLAGQVQALGGRPHAGGGEPPRPGRQATTSSESLRRSASATEAGRRGRGRDDLRPPQARACSSPSLRGTRLRRRPPPPRPAGRQQQGLGQQASTPQGVAPPRRRRQPVRTPRSADSTDVITLVEPAAGDGGPVPMPVGNGTVG